MKPTEIKKLQQRSHNLLVRRITPNTLVVTSRSNMNAHHVVSIETEAGGTIHARCTCPWAINGGVACSHVIAALEALAARRGRRLSFWTDVSEAQRQKKRIFYLRGTKLRTENEGVWITSRAA